MRDFYCDKRTFVPSDFMCFLELVYISLPPFSFPFMKREKNNKTMKAPAKKSKIVFMPGPSVLGLKPFAIYNKG